MITIFNRKELITTMSMQTQSEIRTILSANKIKYFVKTTNRQSASVVGSERARTGSYGINSDFTYLYKIYVNKSDYEQAKYLIEK